MGDYAVTLLTADSVDAYVAHLVRHDEESGTEGELPYGPYSQGTRRDPVEVRARELRRWATPLDQTGWRRAWGLWSHEQVVGSVHVAGGDLPASLHRSDMGVGIERPHRRRGWGRTLVETAIAWARAEPAIDWIDLGVFVGNDSAFALYQALGFVECGRKKDLFRVDGRSIDDIQMSLSTRTG